LNLRDVPLRIKVVENDAILGSAFLKKALEKVALVALSDSDYDALLFISIVARHRPSIG
jgi:hypothetical protein